MTRLFPEDDRCRSDDEGPRLRKHVSDITLIRHGHKKHLGARLSDRNYLFLRLFEGSKDPRNARMGIADESRIQICPSNRLIHRSPNRERHRDNERTGVIARVKKCTRAANDLRIG